MKSVKNREVEFEIGAVVVEDPLKLPANDKSRRTFEENIN